MWLPPHLSWDKINYQKINELKLVNYFLVFFPALNTEIYVLLRLGKSKGTTHVKNTIPGWLVVHTGGPTT